ncbi:MAG: hypothetical protein IJV39_02825 [Ruminococcus sp.]|nr:hypothetical protein [Ruminococcus sp.]
MYKKHKILTLTLLAAVMFLSLVGCDSDKNSDSKLNSGQEETVVSEVSGESSAASKIDTATDTELLGDSAIESILKNSDADGYTICKIGGIEDYQLVLLYGEYEKECQFEFYTVDEYNIENIGSLDGSNITAYISDKTNRLCICYNNSGKYDLSSIKYDGEGILVDWLETVIMENKDDSPDIPGEKVKFVPTDNLKPIGKLKEKLPDNSAEEAVEVEE